MKFNLTNRLYLGFTVALLLVIITGISSYKTYSNQANEQKWVEHTHKVINQLQELEMNVYEMRFAARSFLYTHDSAFKNRFNQQLLIVNSKMTSIAQLINDNNIQTERVEILKNRLDSLGGYLMSSFQKYTSASQQDIIAITANMEPQLNEIARQFQVIMSEERRLLAERESKNASLLRTAITVLVINIVLTLLIISVLVNFIFTEFKRRRKAEEESKLNLSAMQELNAEIRQRNWLLTGVTQLNDSIQSEGTVTDLCDSVLKTLLNYLELPAGAFYTIIDNVKGLHLLSCIGTTENISRSFSEKNTLAIHALQDKKITIAKNIPSTYWAIESALGKTQPGEIAFVPLIQNENLLGIIELGSFKSFTPAQVDFLGVTSKNIVVALQSAQSRRRIKNLLEELGQHRDELLNQQEELYKTNEELSRQTEALQKSEEELRVQEEELRQANEDLRNKNDSLEVAREAMSLKNRELENAVQYKSEFLANMSHELRTPLNSILILGKQLMENKGRNLTEKQIEYARIIYKSGNDLLELINDLLDLSKMEAGKVDIFPEDTSLRLVEQDMRELFDVVAREKEIKFISEIDPGAPMSILTDRQRLEQILKNLLSNSFKFTPNRGEVRLLFSGSGNMNGRLVIRVSDNGIGIPNDKQQVIFNAFQQADGSTNRKYGGTGLGLSICRELVRMLGGEITVDSKEGRGSTFTVTLPSRLPATEQGSPSPLPPTAAQEEATEQHGSEHRVEDDRNAIVHQDENVVLIIEDDAQFASLLRDFAREHNYKAVIASQGDEGVILAKRYRPKGIILDIKLPVIDGWTVLRLLKDDETLKDIPVHIITAAEYDQSAKENTVSYLKKPVDKKDIDQAFTSLMHDTLARFRQILILRGPHLNKDSLEQIFRADKIDVSCTYADSVGQVLEAVERKEYEAIIADVGTDIERAVQSMETLSKELKSRNIPVIVYIDSDISSTDELELMKICDVVIRKTEMSEKRLMDELKLFLSKVQEEEPEHRQEPGTLPTEKVLENKKVLLVDDDMRNIFVLTHILEEYQMKIVPAVNGKDAIEELKKDPDIDIVIMDVMMPEMDGYEAIQKIRKELRLTSLPVIALTAKAMPGDREKIIKAGASDYLSKPVDINRLISLMRVWLSQED